MLETFFIVLFVCNGWGWPYTAAERLLNAAAAHFWDLMLLGRARKQIFRVALGGPNIVKSNLFYKSELTPELALFIVNLFYY